MGNKSAFNYNNKYYQYGPFRPHMGGIQKRAYEVFNRGTSNVGKKARELMKKNLYLFLKSINNFSNDQYHANNDSSAPQNNSNIKLMNSGYHNQYSNLPLSILEEKKGHENVCKLLKQSNSSLYTLPSWSHLIIENSNSDLPMRPVSRNWKESLNKEESQTFGFNHQQRKYQELIHEIILTEQYYVNDLILVYEIFIRQSIRWNGLPTSIKYLFENIFQIIILHLQLLYALKERQYHQHPVIQSITDIFSSFLPQFEVYSFYFSNFEKANNLINENIKIQSELGRYISRRSSWAECRNLPLTAYLLTPIQRVMKYPLFFKALGECLLEKDVEKVEIDEFINELDMLLRYFEEQKKEAEEYLKLEDLAARISGLEGSTINLVKPGRKLVHQGYLTIIQPSETFNTFDNFKEVSFSSSIRPSPALSRRNSTFSISSKRQKKYYIFLFNDLIVCTKERHRKRTEPSHLKSFYGPTPDTLFKISHTPGKLTMIEKSVKIQKPFPALARRGSLLFNSFRKYNNSLINLRDELISPVAESPVDTQQEINPLQFICSIATKNLFNLQFEAETAKEKEEWCNHLESVLSEHVHRNSTVSNATTSNFDHSRRHSTYSFDSNASSMESFNFTNTAWTGYCDIVEKMNVDQEDSKAISTATITTITTPTITTPTITTPTITNTITITTPPTKKATFSSIDLSKDQNFLNTLMDEFDSSIWSTKSELSPLQLRKYFQV